MRASHYSQTVSALTRDPIVQGMLDDLHSGVNLGEWDVIVQASEEYRRRGGTLPGHIGAVAEALTILREQRDQCDCDEEYGPCEQHGETIAQREGSSLRTADELALVYCSDVADIIGAQAEGSARATERARLCEALNAAADPTSGCAWFADPDDADAAQDLVREYEGLAADAGYGTWWDDGYRIVRITGGPLA